MAIVLLIVVVLAPLAVAITLLTVGLTKPNHVLSIVGGAILFLYLLVVLMIVLGTLLSELA